MRMILGVMAFGQRDEEKIIDEKKPRKRGFFRTRKV